MASVKDYLKGDYITGLEVVKGDEAVIIEAPEYVDVVYNNKKETKLEGKVEYKKEIRKLSFNKVNAKNCAKAYGDDTKAWLGKVVEFDVENKVVQGEIRPCLIILPKIEMVKPDWVTEEAINKIITGGYGMIKRDAAIRILIKEREVNENKKP